jgi:hypothetical protein
MSTIHNSKLFCSGAVAVALATALVCVGSAATAASSRPAGPNGASTVAHNTGRARTVSPGGRGVLHYAGRVRFADLQNASRADQRTRTRSALRKPGFFHGPDVAADVSKAVGRSPLVTTPTVVHLNKGGTTQSQSSCGGCQPPDTNGAISGTNIVEAVNLALTVYGRGGALVSRKSLASFFPTSRSISDPHILFDNVAKRWILVFIPVPETTSATPQMFLAVSTSSSPTGSYFKYTMSFGSGLFPLGTLLDYPMVGQDRNAILIGSNNFQRTSSGSFNYLNSTAFAIPKSAAYTGSGFSFPAFPVAFSTQPSIARGVPQKSYPNTYWLAANGGGGYTLYRMTNTGGTPTMVQQGTSANGLWTPPPAANQPAPNTGHLLDTLDGRLQAPPVQSDTFLWFTHTVALGGFPAVRYGAISLSQSGTGGLTPTTANAYATSTSDDWNPSLSLAEPVTNSVRIFLNWAYTDPAAGKNVSLRVSGVGPGQGVPSLAGVGKTLFTGSGSSTNSRFGDYSSVSMDTVNLSTTCTKDKNALVVNEVFNSGAWQVRLARVGTC